MKTLRLFTLLEQLRGRTQPVAAENLAEAQGVSVRTIYRDMVTLQAAGAPVRGESGVGYLLENDYFLPPLNFDVDEREATMLGMRMMAARTGAEYQQAVEHLPALRQAIRGGQQPTGLHFRPEQGKRFEDYLRLLPEQPAGTRPDRLT